MPAVQRHEARILTRRCLAPGLIELTLERDGMVFRAGEEITIHGPAGLGDRPYSILSGEQDEDLRILFRVVPEGALSPWLSQRRPGDRLAFSGPHGSFLLRRPAGAAVFVATGTGIAPAVSFIRTHPALDLHLLHGVRRREDLCYGDQFRPDAYTPCVSGQQAAGCFHGRVTSWFAEQGSVQPDVDYYLCGSNAMIADMRERLLQGACSHDRIFAEPYFYW